METMQDELFDVALAHALTDAFAAELATYEAEAGQFAHLRPTAGQRRAAKRLYRASRPPRAWVGWLKRSAAALLVGFCAAAGIGLAIPEVRAEVWTSLVEVCDAYIHFHFKPKAPVFTVDNLAFDYLPQGFTYAGIYGKPGAIAVYLFEKDDLTLYLRCGDASFADYKFDHENCTVRQIEIEGYEAYAFTPKAGEYYAMVVWSDGETFFLLNALLPVDELIRMAQGISLTGPSPYFSRP